MAMIVLFDSTSFSHCVGHRLKNSPEIRSGIWRASLLVMTVYYDLVVTSCDASEGLG